MLGAVAGLSLTAGLAVVAGGMGFVVLALFGLVELGNAWLAVGVGVLAVVVAALFNPAVWSSQHWAGMRWSRTSLVLLLLGHLGLLGVGLLILAMPERGGSGLLLLPPLFWSLVCYPLGLLFFVLSLRKRPR
ncbi:MAG: hypothetical protein AAF513_05125 [Pseudomonadota bacterium]